MALTNPLREFARGIGAAAWEFDPREGRFLWREGPLDEWFGPLALGAGPRQWLQRVAAADRRSALAALRDSAHAAQDLALQAGSARQTVRSLRLRLTPTPDGHILGLCEELDDRPGAAPRSTPPQPHRAEERYRAYIHQAQQAIWCLEASPPIPLDLPLPEIERRIYAQLRLVECNPAFEATFLTPGMTRPVGRSVQELPGTWLPATRRIIHALAKSRFAKSDSLLGIQGGSGRVRSVHLRTESVMQAGAFQRIWCSAQDVTSRVNETARLANSEQESRTLLSRAAAGIAILNRQRKLVAYNASLERVVGHSLEPLRGQRFRVGGSEERERPWNELLDQARSRGRATGDLKLQRSDGTELELEASATFDESLGGRFYLVARDVSEIRRSQRALNSKQRHADQLARMYTVGQMATRIAHELNQPLAAILNYVQGSLQRLPSDEEWKPVRAALESASVQARRAGTSVKGLRSFVARGAPVQLEVDLDQLLDSTAELFQLQPEAREHNLEIRNELPSARVVADPDQIQQVLLALLQNASEACTPRRGTIRIQIHPDPGPGSEAVVEVHDNGVGFRDSEFERLFAAFESTKPGSLGLGLSISRSILEAHRSRLRWERRAPGLTVFSFRLALASPPPPP